MTPDGRLVIACREAVGLIAQLDACDVAQVQDRAVGVGAENDVAELFRRDQPALRADGVGELLALGNGLAADLAGGVDVVLRLDGGDDVGAVTPSLRQLIGLHPHAQRVLPAKDLHARDALDARDLVLKIDDGVVGQKVLAQLAARRIEGDQHERRGERLSAP